MKIKTSAVIYNVTEKFRDMHFGGLLRIKPCMGSNFKIFLNSFFVKKNQKLADLRTGRTKCARLAAAETASAIAKPRQADAQSKSKTCPCMILSGVNLRKVLPVTLYIITKTLILTAFLAVSAVSACASDVPKDIRNYLMQQKQLPSIRPDGAVIYSSDIMYLPVFPAHLKKVKEIKTAQTYPKNKSMEDFPDLIVFNNNFGLLKVIKTKSGSLSIVQLPEYPEEIKTGVLPQDLMVPRGFSMPETLAGIIGSLYIPVEGSAKAGVKTGAFVSAVKQPSKTEKKPDYSVKRNKVPAELKNKLFFANNYQTEYLQVFSPEMPAPLYSLKTSGVMRDVKPVLNGKYLLAASKDLKSIDVIDAAGEYTVKQIDLTAFPSEIAADDKNEAHVGDRVQVMETRPLSKLKRWRLCKIVEKAK